MAKLCQDSEGLVTRRLVACWEGAGKCTDVHCASTSQVPSHRKSSHPHVINFHNWQARQIPYSRRNDTRALINQAARRLKDTEGATNFVLGIPVAYEVAYMILRHVGRSTFVEWKDLRGGPLQQLLGLIDAKVIFPPFPNPNRSQHPDEVCQQKRRATFSNTTSRVAPMCLLTRGNEQDPTSQRSSRPPLRDPHP